MRLALHGKTVGPNTTLIGLTMFETHLKAMSLSPSLPEEEEGQLYELSFVSQRHHSAWFYITQHYHQTKSGKAAKGEMLIDDVDKLKIFLRAEFNNSYTYRIALVIPPEMSGAEDWMMAPLIEVNEIISAHEEEGSNYVYKVDEEPGIYYSREPDGIWDLGGCKLIYKRQSKNVEASL